MAEKSKAAKLRLRTVQPISSNDLRPNDVSMVTTRSAEVEQANNLPRSISVEHGGVTLEITPDNITTISQLGRGAYGIVERVQHDASSFEMALKRITVSMSQEQKLGLMDLVVLNRATCPNIVTFYGALFWEGDLWIFMEVMDCSLDKFYKKIYPSDKDELDMINSMKEGDFDLSDASVPIKFIPERVLGKIASSVVDALNYLYSLKIIHRDIKPSNILINRRGQVKLCDFGISGRLVNSLAKTFEAGCKPYMAPERINPVLDPERNGYDIRSDVWSLGITMLELSIGKFPYPATPGNFFLQIKAVCEDDPPRLPTDTSRFTDDYRDFITKCLQKDYKNRPYYTSLLDHPFIIHNKNNDILDFVSRVLGDIDTESS